MSNERALMWIGVVGLIAAGFVFGQAVSVSIAAMVAAYLAYERAEAGTL